MAYTGVGHQRAHPRERCDADNCALAVDVDSSDGDGGDESGGGDDAAAARSWAGRGFYAACSWPHRDDGDDGSQGDVMCDDRALDANDNDDGGVADNDETLMLMLVIKMS